MSVLTSPLTQIYLRLDEELDVFRSNSEAPAFHASETPGEGKFSRNVFAYPLSLLFSGRLQSQG
jgi:hypothetical protein